MKLTKNFDSKEFDCKDGTPAKGSDLENVKVLASNLQVLRDHLGKPITITSGYRTVSHNAKQQGSSPVSQHLYGRAADIKVAGMTPRQVANEIEKLIASGKMRQGGIGVYPTFTHYDIRGTKARW